MSAPIRGAHRAPAAASPPAVAVHLCRVALLVGEGTEIDYTLASAQLFVDPRDQVLGDRDQRHPGRQPSSR